MHRTKVKPDHLSSLSSDANIPTVQSCHCLIRPFSPEMAQEASEKQTEREWRRRPEEKDRKITAVVTRLRQSEALTASVQQQLSVWIIETEEMRRLVLFTLLLLQLPVTTIQGGHLEDYKYGPQGSEQHNKSCCSWKCLLFTLQWPGGFCQSLNKETQCRIPQSINTWTIHGLWPQRAYHCCSCWPMFYSDVQELETELTEHWPSLVTTKSSFHFWRDEWNKHGVCAACVEGMNSPLRYFQICLKLRAQFDVHKLLEVAGITPSCEQPYKVAEVHSVLAPHLSDKYEIQCVTDDKDREVLFQMKIPLSHNLTVGCDHHDDTESDPSSWGWSPSPGHPCPPQVPFYYFPIDHQQPQQPCG